MRGTIGIFSLISQAPMRRIVPQKRRMVRMLGASKSESSSLRLLTLGKPAKEKHGTRSIWHFQGRPALGQKATAKGPREKERYNLTTYQLMDIMRLVIGFANMRLMIAELRQ